MSENNVPETNSKAFKIVGWILTIIPSLMLLASGVLKLVMPMNEEALKNLEHIGWSPSSVFKLAFVELGCVLIYLFPRTAVLGAILISAYMGGAIATHARIGEMFIIQILIGVVVWGGLYFRDARIRSLLPTN